MEALKNTPNWIHQQHAWLALSFGFLLPRLTTVKPIPYLLPDVVVPIFHVLAEP